MNSTIVVAIILFLILVLAIYLIKTQKKSDERRRKETEYLDKRLKQFDENNTSKVYTFQKPPTIPEGQALHINSGKVLLQEHSPVVSEEEIKQNDIAYTELESLDKTETLEATPEASEAFATALIPNPPGATLGINKTKRAAIRRMHLKGESYSTIAKHYYLSVRTVKRIIEYVDTYESK